MTRENMPGLARPVRMDDRSSRATDTAFSIFSSASKRVSSITVHLLHLRCASFTAARHAHPALMFLAGAGALVTSVPDLLTCDRTRDIAIREQVEYQDWHAVVHAQAERGGVGHPQARGR